MATNLGTQIPDNTTNKMESGEPRPEPETTTTTTKTDLSYEEIQQQAFCNWCRNPMVMSEAITEANFVDVGKKWHPDDTKNATALYCSECLANDFRKQQPKAAINRTNLSELNVADLPPSA